MTYYKVVRVETDNHIRKSVIRGMYMFVEYIPNVWVAPDCRFAEVGALLFLYTNKDTLASDIVCNGWERRDLEIWECEAVGVEHFYAELDAIYSLETDLRTRVVSHKKTKCGFGVVVAEKVKLTKLVAELPGVNEMYRHNCVTADRIERVRLAFKKKERDMEAKIEYRHYRPRVGQIKGLKRGSTPMDYAYRYYRGHAGFKPDPRGGYTICTITTPNGNVYEGIGNCSVTDVFCFEKGREWALANAVKQILEGDVGGVKRPMDGQLAWLMSMEDGKTIARWLKTIVNSDRYSDSARNELYKALNGVTVSGLPSKV